MNFSTSEKTVDDKDNSVSLEEISPGCFFYREPFDVSYINQNIIDRLLISLNKNELKLGRICLHKDHSDLIQIMIIALHEDYQVNYHFHNGPEILKIISGELLIKELLSNGKSKKHYLSKKEILLLRMEEGIKHSVKSLSGWAVFLEIGNGPFDCNKTNYI